MFLFKEYVKVVPVWSIVRLSPARNSTSVLSPTLVATLLPVAWPVPVALLFANQPKSATLSSTAITRVSTAWIWSSVAA